MGIEESKSIERKRKDLLEEISLLQTTNVTFGKYSLNETQENILTLIIEKLQKYMTNTEVIGMDYFGQPEITIDCDEAGGRNHKFRVIEEAKDMTRKLFSFRWVDSKIHHTMESCGVIITTIHNVINTNIIKLTLNIWAIPFLLYYGDGCGGTYFKKSIALSLRGDRVKRLYKFVCSQHDITDYYYLISQFRHDYEIPDKFNNAYILRSILKPAAQKIKESGSPIWFEVEMVTRKNTHTGRKPKYDCIHFRITNLTPKSNTEQRERKNFIYGWLLEAYEHRVNDSERAYDYIVNSNRFEEIYNRILWWVENHERVHVCRCIKKLMREDFNFKENYSQKRKYYRRNSSDK